MHLDYFILYVHTIVTYDTSNTEESNYAGRSRYAMSHPFLKVGLEIGITVKHKTLCNYLI